MMAKYKVGQKMKVLPWDQVKDPHGVGYVPEMVAIFKKNNVVEIVKEEIHSNYVEYIVKDCIGEKWYVDESRLDYLGTPLFI